jgi:hypothetical protein
MTDVHNYKRKWVAAKLNLEFSLMMERLTIWRICKIPGNKWYEPETSCLFVVWTCCNELTFPYSSGNECVIFNRLVKSGKRNQLRIKQNFGFFTRGGVRNHEPTLCRWKLGIYIVRVCVVIRLSTGRNMQYTSKRMSVTNSNWTKNKGWVHIGTN